MPLCDSMLEQFHSWTQLRLLPSTDSPIHNSSACISSTASFLPAAQINLIWTTAKDVLPNTDCTQAAFSVNSRHPVTPPPPSPGCDGMVQSAAGWCQVQRTAYATPHNALSMGTTQQFSRFCSWWPWPLTLTFKRVQERDQTHLPCEFLCKSVQRFPRYLR